MGEITAVLSTVVRQVGKQTITIETNTIVLLALPPSIEDAYQLREFLRCSCWPPQKFSATDSVVSAVVPGQSQGRRTVSSSGFHIFRCRRRKALVITDTELNVIGALAMIGLRSRPKNG